MSLKALRHYDSEILDLLRACFGDPTSWEGSGAPTLTTLFKNTLIPMHVITSHTSQPDLDELKPWSKYTTCYILKREYTILRSYVVSIASSISTQPESRQLLRTLQGLILVHIKRIEAIQAALKPNLVFNMELVWGTFLDTVNDPIFNFIMEEFNPTFSQITELVFKGWFDRLEDLLSSMLVPLATEEHDLDIVMFKFRFYYGNSFILDFFDAPKVLNLCISNVPWTSMSKQRMSSLLNKLLIWVVKPLLRGARVKRGPSRGEWLPFLNSPMAVVESERDPDEAARFMWMTVTPADPLQASFFAASPQPKEKPCLACTDASAGERLWRLSCGHNVHVCCAPVWIEFGLMGAGMPGCNVAHTKVELNEEIAKQRRFYPDLGDDEQPRIPNTRHLGTRKAIGGVAADVVKWGLSETGWRGHLSL